MGIAKRMWTISAAAVVALLLVPASASADAIGSIPGDGSAATISADHTVGHVDRVWAMFETTGSTCSPTPCPLGPPTWQAFLVVSTHFGCSDFDLIDFRRRIWTSSVQTADGRIDAGPFDFAIPPEGLTSDSVYVCVVIRWDLANDSFHGFRNEVVAFRYLSEVPAPPPPPPPIGAGAATAKTKEALHQRYKWRWSEGARKKIACSLVKPKKTKYRCDVSWKYKKTIFKGYTLVPASPDSTAPVRVKVKAKR